MLVLLLPCILFFSACNKDDKDPDTPKGPDLDFYVLSNNGTRLMRFNASTPGTAKSTVTVSGLQSGEAILAIDFRPATGQLYALGSDSRIYVLDPSSGQARQIGNGSFTPALSGNIAGFDFNPAVDRIRVVTSGGQNLRLHPETGTVVATDGNLNGVANAAVSSAAYTDNRAGTATTVLYDIDTHTDMLYKQDPPNDGTLVSVGALGVDLSGDGGFDIGPSNNTALAVYTVSGQPVLFTINLSSGAATNVGNLGGAADVTGLAIPTMPVAYAITGGTSLLIFNPESPAPVTKSITGMAPSETVLGIDFRPATGQLYALGSTSKLYVLNLATGAATGVGTLPFSTLLLGSRFGFDFNPAVDRIRVVSDQGQNLRLNPNDGLLAAVDGPLNPGTPAISAAAYSNNFAGTASTILYDIDHVTDRLYKQDPPNDGGLVEVGSLGINVESSNGFDIGGASGKAWAILTVGSTTRLYSIDLSTGAATASGTYTFSGSVDAFAIGLGF